MESKTTDTYNAQAIDPEIAADINTDKAQQPSASFDGFSTSISDTKSQHQANTRNYIKDGFQNRTRGEKMFNRITYTGVGYFGVTAFSVWLTWLLKDSKILSKAFNNHSFTESVEAVKVAWEKAPEKSLKRFFSSQLHSISTIGALFTGGTVVSVLPIKALEDNKASIVKSLDHKLYTPEELKADPSIEESHKKLEAAPRQTWVSVFTSRFTAFALTLAAWFAVGTEKSPLAKATKINDNSATHKDLNGNNGWSLDNLAITTGRSIDKMLHKDITKPGNAEIRQRIHDAKVISPIDVTRGGTYAVGHELAGQKISEEKTDRVLSRVLSYITQDSLYTLITSQSLWVATRIFGPIFDKPHEGMPKKDALEPTLKPTPHTRTEPAPVVASTAPKKPETQVENIRHVDRVGAMPTPALGA